MQIKYIQNKKHRSVNLIYIFVLFLFPVSIKAKDENVDIVLGKFFNHTVESLVFKSTQNVYVFKNNNINLGNTVIPNPFKNFKPIGPLNFIQIPTNALIDISNFVLKEADK